MAPGSPLADRLDAVVAEQFGEDADWTLTATTDGYRITLPDRRLDLDRRGGPGGSTHWITTLRADGATVGKFGPDASADALLDRCRRLLSSDATYTVCCDGRPE